MRRGVFYCDEGAVAGVTVAAEYSVLPITLSYAGSGAPLVLSRRDARRLAKSLKRAARESRDYDRAAREARA